MRRTDISTSSDNGTLDLQQSQAWCTLTCEDCGNEFNTLRILANSGQDLCNDCRDTDPLNIRRSGIVGGNECLRQGFDRPLMENGPLSLGSGGGR